MNRNYIFRLFISAANKVDIELIKLHSMDNGSSFEVTFHTPNGLRYLRCDADVFNADTHDDKIIALLVHEFRCALEAKTIS